MYNEPVNWSQGENLSDLNQHASRTANHGIIKGLSYLSLQMCSRCRSEVHAPEVEGGEDRPVLLEVLVGGDVVVWCLVLRLVFLLVSYESVSSTLNSQ